MVAIGEPFVALSQVRIGDQRRHLQRRERCVIRFTILARVRVSTVALVRSVARASTTGSNSSCSKPVPCACA